MLGKMIVNIELFFLYLIVTALHLLFTLSYFYENTIINHI